MVNHVFLVALGMIVVILATAQTSRLLIDDKIFDGFRKRVEKIFGDFRESNISYVLTFCFWCLNVWASFFWTATALACAIAFAELDWRIAVVAWLPSSLAMSYTASRVRKTEGD
jgi:hypothetical protein